MLGRLKTSKQGTNLPTEWPEDLARLLNETYEEECNKAGRHFEVYCQVFPEEFLLVVSYLSEKDKSLSPIALFLTCDPGHISNEDKFRNTQQNYLDLVGLFFDEILNDSEWNDFGPTWQEVGHNNQNYYYKISRENISLTLEANRLLGPEFDDVEFESDSNQ